MRTIAIISGGPDNLLSGWPKATGGDPKASLDPCLRERSSRDLLCPWDESPRARTTSSPGHPDHRAPLPDSGPSRGLRRLPSAFLALPPPAWSAPITPSLRLPRLPPPTRNWTTGSRPDRRTTPSAESGGKFTTIPNSTSSRTKSTSPTKMSSRPKPSSAPPPPL